LVAKLTLISYSNLGMSILSGLADGKPDKRATASLDKWKGNAGIELASKQLPTSSRIVVAIDGLAMEIRVDNGKLPEQFVESKIRLPTMHIECDTNGDGNLDLQKQKH